MDTIGRLGSYLIERRQRKGIKRAVTGATALFLAIATAGCGSTPPPTPAGHLATPLASQSVSVPATTSLPTSSAAATSASPTATSAPPTKAPVIVPVPTKPATSQPVRVLPPPVQPTSAPASTCYPLTNGGNCYEPGEFCRKSDHGATGVAGDGKRIVCAYNNGWRWEPV
jgi:hypothetical protein